MKWIETKKELPETDVDILVYVPEEESVSIAKYYGDINMFMDDTDAEFWASHWMPLPLPPNVKEAE